MFRSPIRRLFGSERSNVLGPRLIRYIDRAATEYKAAIESLASTTIDANQREEMRRIVSKFDGISALYTKYKSLSQEHEQVSSMASREADAEMRALAETELDGLFASLNQVKQEMRAELLRPDDEDSSSAILEIRAGTGGDEAAIFCMELFEMYQRYSELNSWRFEAMSLAQDGPGALREGIARIEGWGVFGRLKWESGVHRVQRIPVTESQGRIHTSTVTVAIMPEPSSDSSKAITIPEKDIRIDVYRSGGAGGQHAQKTNSAVRVVHLPTGTTVCIQEERDQQKNRARAMTILQARLGEAQRRSAESERQNIRQAQIGNADRSEKVRTYNFPQGRITDHRINQSVFGIDEFLGEGRGLDELIDRLKLQEELSRLEHLESAE